ncbi:type II secretion system F family protein [Kiritimatiellaeota bacterium B1221]|nr:type II secretion system F family protein [Kiritimatiellaeota bacterium B1221]
MPQFRYTAVTENGSNVEGKLEAGGRREALHDLESRGLIPIRLEEHDKSEKNSAPADRPKKRSNKKISFADLEDFTRSLASLLAASVPLSRALSILCREAPHPAAEAHWREVHNQVIDGVALADAMAKQPEVFPRVYVAMVAAGEAGGFLDVVLNQIADFQTRERELRTNVMGALLYPCILMFMALAVLVFLLVFFIPRFEVLFNDFQAELPLLTKVIISASDFLVSYGLFLALALGLGAYYLQRWLSGDAGRRKLEKLLLHAPMVGPLLARVAMARFCRMLGTLLGAGVPLMNGLTVARRSIGFQTLTDMVADTTERVSRGEGLASSLGESRTLFPGSALEMISVAEESGRLDSELLRLADTSERDLDRSLKTTVALMEPLLLFAIAGFIGMIFVGMVIPIFSIQDYIQ